MKRIIFPLILISLTLSSHAQEPVRLRVLSYYIYHGATMKGDFNLDTIADVIASLKPDLVALQEVDRLTNRARKMDLVTELGLRTKLAPLFGRAMYYDSGEDGEGILSAFSFVSSCNRPLPASPDHEPRCALEVLVALPSGDTIAFVGTHLDHTRNSNDRIDQARLLADTYKNYPYPVLLAGDLNATPDSEAMGLIRQVFNMTAPKPYAPTIPSDDPKKKIDYIMSDKAHKWKVLESRVIQDEVVSDHCGYFVILELDKK